MGNSFLGLELFHASKVGFPHTFSISYLFHPARSTIHAGDLELNSSQLDRFDQIVLQARNWKAVVTPELAERLKLSSDQVSRIRTLLAEVPRLREENEKTIAGLSASNQEAARNRQLKAESKKFAVVLTAQQEAQLSKLLGKSFDLDRVTNSDAWLLNYVRSRYGSTHSR